MIDTTAFQHEMPWWIPFMAPVCPCGEDCRRLSLIETFEANHQAELYSLYLNIAGTEERARALEQFFPKGVALLRRRAP